MNETRKYQRFGIELKHFDNSEGGGCRIYVNGDIARGCTAHGCGYDRGGAALGNWIEKEFQAELKKYFDNGKLAGYYGVNKYEGKISVDGGTGKSNMIDLLRALGFSVDWLPVRSKWSDFYLVKSND